MNSMKKNNILKSRFFLKLFGIPSACWIVLSLIAMLPDEADPDPLTWGECLTASFFLLAIWFGISWVITWIATKIKNRKMNTAIKNDVPTEKQSGLIKSGMFLLFIITLVCLWGALASVEFVNKFIPQYGFDFAKNMWVFWCWLPIPIASIILGFKYKKAGYKCKKNIVAGFIIGILLLIYGSFCLFPTFSEDYNKIGPYKEIIDVKVPDNGVLEIQDWGTYFDEDKTKYTIINAYYEQEDVRSLVESIENSDHWVLSKTIKSELRVFVPSQLRSDEDAYFSIYNKTTDQYNSLPDSTGEYEVYAMKYDKSDKQLEIHKFNIVYIK